ncbi:MAG TPA: hypothetical protein VNK41_03305 [Vicinamibacterales bacterium]|nr:hypothetical protein [Vicinamibacterales bacterium]
MECLRRRLRLFAATWLVFQAAWFAALVPRDCCAAHRPPDTSCHEEARQPTHCPMRAADGTPCPMHRGAEPMPVGAASTGHEHHEPPSPAPADCRLIGTCDGPLSALFALLSTHGVLPESPSVPLALDVRPAALVPDEVPDGLTRLPDSPPPRA